MDWINMSRKDRNIILRQHGYRWRRVPDHHEEAEEEIAGWLLYDSQGREISETDAFAAISTQTTSDSNDPMLFDTEPSTHREDWVQRGWYYKQRGSDGKWFAQDTRNQQDPRRKITKREYYEVYPPVEETLDVESTLSETEWQMVDNAPLDTRLHCNVKAHTLALLEKAVEMRKTRPDDLVDMILAEWLYSNGY